MADILNFEKAKIQRYIQQFHQGGLPSYLADKTFKKDYPSIDEVLEHWSYVLDDENLLPVFQAIHRAYLDLQKEEIKKERSSSQHLVNHYGRVKRNLKTMNKRFWNPAVHAGYPKDQNPVKIACYEFSESFKRFNDHPYALSEETKFKLSFANQMGNKMIDALEEDIDSIDQFIHQWSTDPVSMTMKDQPEIKEAKLERDEFIVCLNTIRTISELLPKNT